MTQQHHIHFNDQLNIADTNLPHLIGAHRLAVLAAVIDSVKPGESLGCALRAFNAAEVL